SLTSIFSAIAGSGLPSGSRRVRPSNTLDMIAPDVVSVASAGWNDGGSDVMERLIDFSGSPSPSALSASLLPESPPKLQAARAKTRPARSNKLLKLFIKQVTSFSLL